MEELIFQWFRSESFYQATKMNTHSDKWLLLLLCLTGESIDGRERERERAEWTKTDGKRMIRMANDTKKLPTVNRMKKWRTIWSYVRAEGTPICVRQRKTTIARWLPNSLIHFLINQNKQGRNSLELEKQTTPHNSHKCTDYYFVFFFLYFVLSSLFSTLTLACALLSCPVRFVW